jgi:periplasmic protein TonB
MVRSLCPRVELDGHLVVESVRGQRRRSALSAEPELGVSWGGTEPGVGESQRRRSPATTTIKLFGSALLGAFISLAMFYVLWYSIGGTANVQHLQQAVRINFTRMRRDTPVETKRDREVERKPPPPTPETPKMSLGAADVDGAVAHLSPSIDVNRALHRFAMTEGSDRDVIPLVRIPPDYPPRALARGLEGWVEVQFTITPIGTVTNAKVVQADPPEVFNDAALKAIARWRYNPKIEGGQAVERVGVQTVIRFELQK